MPLIEDSLSDILGGQDIRFGLPDKEVASVCKQMYKNDVVKVTLQIGEPEAMQLKMDVAITFADALGIVGEILTKAMCAFSAKKLNFPGDKNSEYCNFFAPCTPCLTTKDT